MQSKRALQKCSFLYKIGKFCFPILYKKGVVGDEIPCPPSGRYSGCRAAVKGTLGFPSESIEDAFLLYFKFVEIFLFLC